MKYLVIDTSPEYSSAHDDPTNWTILGAAETLEAAKEIARLDAQICWDGWEDKETMTAARFFHPYLIVCPEMVLTVSLKEQRLVLVTQLTI